jgi:hypothetical protein
MEKPVRGLFRHHTRVRTFQSHMDKVTVSSRRSCFVIVFAENSFLMTELTKALKPTRTRTMLKTLICGITHPGYLINQTLTYEKW